MSRKLLIAAASAGLFFSAGGRAPAAVMLTEFCSNSGDGGLFEFVEFTNTGATPQSMVGWSQDDGTRTPNKINHVLSAVGTLQPGESAIITEASPDNFRTYWWGSVAAAPAGLKIVGPYTNDNLSSSGDELNLYDNTSTLVDRLTYNASATPPSGGGNANGVTRNAPASYVINSNRNIDWLNSSVGDAYGSFTAAGNASLIGNPGTYAVPEPASLGLIAIGGVVFAGRRRRNAR